MSDNNPDGKRGGTGTLNWESAQARMEEGKREPDEPLKEKILNRVDKRDSQMRQDGIQDVAQGAELEVKPPDAKDPAKTQLTEITPDEFDDINH